MDKKISQLTALTTADQADVYAIVDTSATETKKITQNDLEDTIANSTNFVDELVGNSYFTTELANDPNFVSELTTNSSFQSAVNNFVTTVSNSGGGAGGKPITFSLTDTVTAASNPLSGYSDAEAVVYSSGATIYMQDAIGYTQSRLTSTDWASSTTVVSYVLLNAYAYVLLSSGAALQVYRYNRNDLSAGGTLMTISGATLTYGANVVMTSNGADFFFNYEAGQSADSFDIAKFTLSGTTLTYDSTVAAGSTANRFAGAFAVDTLENYYGTNAGIIYQYDSAGALQVTSGITLATISRLFNWDNTLYGCDSGGQFFNKLYMQDTDLTGGSSNKIAIDFTDKSAVTNFNESYTVAIPGGTLGLNGGFKFRLLLGAIVFGTSGGDITLAATYGGVALNTTITESSTGSGTAYSTFLGEVISTGATNAQTSRVEANYTIVGGSPISPIISQTNSTLTVDSTVDQNLVVTITGTGAVAITAQIKGLIVERI